MVNKPLIRPAISGGGTLGGGRLTSHEKILEVTPQKSNKGPERNIQYPFDPLEDLFMFRKSFDIFGILG